MNWFHLLKVQRQTQRQGVSARQKDEEFIFEDEDDCHKQLMNYIQSNFKERPTISGHRYFSRPADNDYVFMIQFFGDMRLKGYKALPDEKYCIILDKIKDLIENHDSYENHMHYKVLYNEDLLRMVMNKSSKSFSAQFWSDEDLVVALSYHSAISDYERSKKYPEEGDK